MVEHTLHTGGVASSIPAAPTTLTGRRALIAGLAAITAAPRAFAQPLPPWLDARGFGARFDGVTSDTVALQRALDAAGRDGRTLRLPAGRARLTAGAGDACLTITRAVRLIGEGAFGSCLIPDRDLSSATDIFRVAPDPAFAADFLTFEKFAIADPIDGRRGGHHAIAAATRGRGGALPKLTLRDLFVGLGGGAAFVHANDAAANPNGGLYGALIENCELRGAIRLEGSGDSIRIVGNIIAGPGTGIFARQIAGAAMLSLIDNNITSDDGGIDVAGDAVAIHRNIIEHSAPGAAGGAPLSIGVAGRRSPGCAVTGNIVSAFGRSRAGALVRAIDCDGLELGGNMLLSGTRGRAGIEIGAGCRDTRLGANARNANVLAARDLGVGTQGSAAADTAINR